MIDRDWEARAEVAFPYATVATRYGALARPVGSKRLPRRDRSADLARALQAAAKARCATILPPAMPTEAS